MNEYFPQVEEEYEKEISFIEYGVFLVNEIEFPSVSVNIKSKSDVNIPISVNVSCSLNYSGLNIKLVLIFLYIIKSEHTGKVYKCIFVEEEA